MCSNVLPKSMATEIELPDFLIVVPDNIIVFGQERFKATIKISEVLSVNDSTSNIRIFRWQNGKGEIEHKDGSINKLLESARDIQDQYAGITDLIKEQWIQCQAKTKEDQERLETQMKEFEAYEKSWDHYRIIRTQMLNSLDVPVVRYLENAEPIPSELLALRVKLRNLPTEHPDPMTIDWDALRTVVATFT